MVPVGSRAADAVCAADDIWHGDHGALHAGAVDASLEVLRSVLRRMLPAPVIVTLTIQMTKFWKQMYTQMDLS